MASLRVGSKTGTETKNFTTAIGPEAAAAATTSTRTAKLGRDTVQAAAARMTVEEETSAATRTKDGVYKTKQK